MSSLLAGAGARSISAATETPAEFDRRISAELKVLSPEAEALFAQANAAREKGDHERASSLYARVYEMAPAFVHALRRECVEETRLGHRDRALPLCRKAVENDGSAENLAALALTLITIPKGYVGANPASGTEALDLAKRAAQLKPEDPFMQTVLCQAALSAQDLQALRTGVEALQRQAPDTESTHVFAVIVAVSEGRFKDAERDLGRAHELGLDETQYRSLRKYISDARPLGSRLLPVVGIVAGAWLGGLALLLLSGWVLSRAALRAAARVPGGPGGTARGIDALLRRTYAGVLWLCCGYYYLSLPIVCALVLIVGGGIVYGFFAIGQIPIKLVVIVAALTLATLWAVLRSLFVRTRHDEPGMRLDLAAHPKVGALLQEVALGLGTRPVDSVYVTPGTEIAVMERGGMLRQLAGRRERCLLLGAGVLEGMRVGPFKAILAHEYGHLSNQDTAGGNFALAVRRSLLAMAGELARSGAATWYNPAWLFLNGFYRVFLRISQGASRLQEVLADRWAATLYGAKAFEEGLRYVIERTVRFDAHAGATLQEVVDAKAALANLYHYQPAKPPTEEEIGKAVREALERKPSPYDSHPSPADRFAWVRALPGQGTASSPADAAEVWSLFEDRDAIEREMTTTVRKSILARYGVEIAAAAPTGI